MFLILKFALTATLNLFIVFSPIIVEKKIIEPRVLFLGSLYSWFFVILFSVITVYLSPHYANMVDAIFASYQQ